VFAIPEADVQVLIFVFFVEGQPTFELHLMEGFAVTVLHNEIGSVPIVTQANGYKAEIGQHCGDFLKVVGLLLAAVEILLIVDFLLEFDGH
jgi:hypothetical protein